MQKGFLKTSGWKSDNNYYIATNLQIDTNYEQTEIQQGLAYRWPIIAIGWLVLSVLEFIDDEGRIFRGVIFLVFAILWAVIYFNELKKFKKEE